VNAIFIDISDLNAADVLAALWNGGRPIGPSWLQPEPMTAERAQAWLDTADDAGGDFEGYKHLDYVDGRAMKLFISNESVEALIYDRDNGPGRAREIINALRESNR
jgi:hypothetical protein